MNQQLIHKIPAGILPTDNRVEFVADRESREVFFMQNGITKPLFMLSRKHKKNLLLNAIKDPMAMKDLRGTGYSFNEALQEYTFCMYGLADSNGDIKEDGSVGVSENFRCGTDCKCLKWASKQIQIDGCPITPKEIDVLDMLQSEHTDEYKAHLLGITRSTLNTHKKNLFNKFQVASVTSLVCKAIERKIIQ